MVSEEGKQPLHPSFFLIGKCDCDSTENRLNLEELIAWNRPQEGGGRVQGHDKTPGIGVACDTLSGAWAFAVDKDFTIEEQQVAV